MRQIILASVAIFLTPSPSEVDFRLEIASGTKLAKVMTHQASYELTSCSIEVSDNEMPVEMSMAFDHHRHIVCEDRYGEFDQRGPKELTRVLSTVKDTLEGEAVPFIGDKQGMDLAFETVLVDRPVRWVRAETGDYAPMLSEDSQGSDPEWLDGLVYDSDGRELLPPEGANPEDGWQVSPPALAKEISSRLSRRIRIAPYSTGRWSDLVRNTICRAR